MKRKVYDYYEEVKNSIIAASVNWDDFFQQDKEIVKEEMMDIVTGADNGSYFLYLSQTDEA